jgi:hypothetical protein
MPGYPGVTVVTMLVCFFIFACEAAGASSARHSLRPLMFRMAQRTAQLGYAPRDRGGVCGGLRGRCRPLCHRPRRRTIQYSREVVMELKIRGVLDHPLSRVMTATDSHRAQPPGRGVWVPAFAGTTTNENAEMCVCNYHSRHWHAGRGEDRRCRESASSRRPHPRLRFAVADPPHNRGRDKKERVSRDLRRGEGALNGRLRHWTFSHTT